MNPGMYIFINKGLGMSTGKIAAQAGHAAVEGYRLSMWHPSEKAGDAYWVESTLVRLWYKGGHYAKYVMEARDRDHLLDIERYLNARGFKTSLIIDEGHTEIAPISPTALGVEIVDRDDPHVQATFSSFDLYREQPKVTILEHADALSASQYAEVRTLVERGEIGMARDAMKLYAGKKKRWWKRHV